MTVLRVTDDDGVADSLQLQTSQSIGKITYLFLCNENKNGSSSSSNRNRNLMNKIDWGIMWQAAFDDSLSNQIWEIIIANYNIELCSFKYLENESLVCE